MSDIPVDVNVLNELRSIMAEEFQLLIDVFISDSEQRLKTIETAILNNDADTLRSASHSFKGSSLNISADTLTELCRELEFMGKDKNLGRAAEVFVAAKNEFARVRAYLLTI